MQITSGIRFGAVFDHGDISETTFSNSYCFEKLSIIQTCPGTTRFGLIKTGRFVQSPNLRKPGIPIETKKTRNAIRNRVHRISARDHFSGPVSRQKCFLRRTNRKASEHQSVA